MIKLLFQAIIWIPLGIIAMIYLLIPMTFALLTGGSPKEVFRKHMEKGTRNEEDLRTRSGHKRKERDDDNP